MATPRLCDAPNCGKPSRGRYCEMHRARLARGGSLEPRQPKKSVSELLGGASSIGDWAILGEGEPYRRPTLDGSPHPDGVQRTARCECVCGVVRDIAIHTLKRGSSKHCGCKVSALITEMKTTHGKCYTPEYRSWAKLKERCLNPNCKDWPNYGGRGIKVCDRWLESFEAFYSDMGARPDGHSIDRIDCDGDYEPGNCRWATGKQQMQNVRHNVLVQFNGETIALREACRRLGREAEYKLIWQRMKRGKTFEAAVA